MDDGKAYWLRNKLESDVGDAVDVTGTISVLDDVGIKLPQPARRNTIRIKPEAAPDFILFRL